jgi:hypothetical protein
MRALLLSLIVLVFGVSQALCACPPDSGSDAQISHNNDHHSDKEHACDGCQHCDRNGLFAGPLIDKVEATWRTETKIVITDSYTGTVRIFQLRGPPAQPIELRWRIHANSPISRHDVSLT